MKAIMKNEVIHNQLQYVDSMPHFNSLEEAIRGDKHVIVNNSSYWHIFNINKGQSNITTNSTITITVFFDTPFKITKAYRAYLSARKANFRIVSYDHLKEQRYDIDNRILDKSTYHTYYRIKLSPQAYTNSDGETAYEGTFTFIYLAGYYWVEDKDYFTKEGIDITFLKPKKCYSFKIDDKYYMFKHTI